MAELFDKEIRVDARTIGLVSAGLVAASAIPYAWRAWRREIQPNLTSWALWALIGFALLLTYDSSGADQNVWPAVTGFVNPLIIAAIVWWRRGKREPLERTEVLCLAFGLTSLAMWWFVRSREDLAQYALYLAIVADACAAIPTIRWAWAKPWDERPFAWTMFAFAYGLSVFAIREHTFANWSLPLYMFGGALFVAWPLIRYRTERKIPLVEWI